MRQYQAMHLRPLFNAEDHKLARSRIKSAAKTRDHEKRRARERAAGPVEVGDVVVMPKVVRRWKPLQRNLVHELEFGPLTAWMKRFALWLAQQTMKPTWREQARRATGMAMCHVRTKDIKLLRSRRDFQAYYETVQQDVLSRSRAEYEELYPLMVAVQKKALEQAELDGNVKPVSKLITEGMDRLLPKKSDGPLLAREVHIHLAPGQSMERLLSEATPEEVEIVVERPEVVE